MATYEKQTVSEDNRPDQVDVDGRTYLRVAETVLAKALSPLKAREIVERGIEQGLFGDHVMGRTPEKSMQARLSIDILTREDSPDLSEPLAAASHCVHRRTVSLNQRKNTSLKSVS